MFTAMISCVDISGGNLAPFPGGIVVLNENGEVIGSVGVSGASGDEDEYSAIRGVLESGFSLKTVPEKHSCTTTKEQL